MKVQDRLLLGLIAGLGANIPKLAIGLAGKKLRTTEIDGPDIAAGIFMPGYKLATLHGKVVGYLADATIAGILGTATVYALSITGKDHYLLKGLATGQVMWQGIYGLMSSLGVTQVKAARSKSVLNEFVSHTVFGIAATAIAANLGDVALFSGRQQISASVPVEHGAVSVPRESTFDDIHNPYLEKQPTT